MGRESPFIGPRPFKEDEAEVFFGRENELAALAAEVVSTQIVLLYAASGSGKSSLINAGLIPVMRDEGFGVAQERLSTITSADWQLPVDSLHEAIRESGSGSSPEQPSLLVLDQFEEIVMAASYEELRALSKIIYSTMARNPLARIVISFREEYLARIGALFNKATEASVGHYHLDRLSRSGALEAFKRSLGVVRFKVEPKAEELFLEKLTPPTQRRKSEVGFEPLYLQLLGSQLWSSIANRSPTPTSQDTDGLKDVPLVVTVADVGRLVDFDQAIEDFYDSTISRVCMKHHVPEKAMRDWIDRELVTPDETRSMVRRQEDETKGIQNDALDDLAKVGLLRTEPRGDDLWLELAHDQLVERIREFNRIWWNGRIYTRLLDRNERFLIALGAARPDYQRWVATRSALWAYSSALHESAINLSRWYGRWLPFARKRPDRELDRLGLRAFVLGGTVFNSLVTLYRSSAAGNLAALGGIEGLDAETAKRRLQATALNLGRTEQLLVAANIAATFAWAGWLSRRLARSAIGAPPMDRRRQLYVGVLFSADVVLTMLRSAVRNGLIENCLDPAAQIQRSRAVERTGVAAARRCMSLVDAAAWSKEHPVLLVLDWRSGVDGATGFQRFLDQEVPLYENALRARGAIAAWCCRANVRRRGWRDSISGIGYPAMGQRTYYMVENGHVVAWRTVKLGEFPMQLRANIAEATDSMPQANDREIKTKQRFAGILTLLIASSEAGPSFWHEFGEQYFKSVQGLRRREDTQPEVS